jgi:hypothetical protein
MVLDVKARSAFAQIYCLEDGRGLCSACQENCERSEVNVQLKLLKLYITATMRYLATLLVTLFAGGSSNIG